MEALYPSLDIERVSRIVYKAIMKTNVKWANVDYLEAARYLALNWSAERCKTNTLRRILPVRRGTRGVRPGGGERVQWGVCLETKNNEGFPK